LGSKTSTFALVAEHLQSAASETKRSSPAKKYYALGGAESVPWSSLSTFGGKTLRMWRRFIL